MTHTTLQLPALVRVKPGALDRVGIYLDRAGRRRVLTVQSDGLPAEYRERLATSLRSSGIESADAVTVASADFESVWPLFTAPSGSVDAVIGLGGGKALDVAKYLAFLSRTPFYAVPTSLSNDGFCSPQSSLVVGGKRRSLPSAFPDGVVIDTAVCLAAPRPLWHSGVGDLAAKLTAVADWKLAFHRRGTPVNDLAALLSNATVLQYLAAPTHDLEGIRLLGTALLLNGLAMQMSGSSRPASGSEHLISHALDAITARPRLHGLQVGVATYLVSHWQGGRETPWIAELFERTGFWESIRRDPFSADEWRRAVADAPGLKQDFHTVLDEVDAGADFERRLESDSLLRGCFE